MFDLRVRFVIMSVEMFAKAVGTVSRLQVLLAADEVKISLFGEECDDISHENY